MKKLLYTLFALFIVSTAVQAQDNITKNNVTILDTLKSAANDSLILVKGHLVPSRSATYNLGRVSLPWNNVFVRALYFSNGDSLTGTNAAFGSLYSIQYNDSGRLAGSNNFNYNGDEGVFYILDSDLDTGFSYNTQTEETRIFGPAFFVSTPADASPDSILGKGSGGQVVSMAYSQGVYVPVDSAGSNVDGVTPDTAFYTRAGNVVTVSGVVEIDPTTTLTPTFFYMNVPVFPLNWSVNRAGGTFSAYIVNEGGAAIMGGPTSVLFQFLPVSVGANIFSYTYSYRIQ